MDATVQSEGSRQTAENLEQRGSNPERPFSKKCSIHENQRCDLLLLNSSSKKHQICVKCAQNDKIPLSQVVFFDDLMKADSNTFLSAFPMLLDSDLIEQIESANISVDNIIKQTDEYFSELKEQLNFALETAKSRAKSSLAKLSGLHFDMISSYQDILKIKEFKKIIIDNNKRNDDQILHDYISNIYQQSSVNTQHITETLNSLKNLTATYNISTLQAVQKQLTEIILNINIIEDTKSIIPFNILPSVRIGNPFTNNLQIIKESTGSMMITNITDSNLQCYLDVQLQINEKYIIRLEIIHNNMIDTKNPGFSVGLIEDSLKQNKYILDSQMAYGECTGGWGIDKIVRGPQLFSNKQSKAKRSLEFRIHLGSRYIRAANLPDYSSVVELGDISKIKEGKKYYFGITIYWGNDQVRIVEVLKVRSFDNKMDK